MADGSTVTKQFGDPAHNDLPVPGDYEGIGKYDLALFRPDSGQWFVRTSDGKTPIAQFGDPAHGDLAVPGDYDGDGKTDFAIFRPGTALFVVQYTSGGKSYTQLGDPAHGDLPVAAPLASLGLIQAAAKAIPGTRIGVAAVVVPVNPAPVVEAIAPGPSVDTTSAFEGQVVPHRNTNHAAWITALDDLASGQW